MRGGWWSLGRQGCIAISGQASMLGKQAQGFGRQSELLVSELEQFDAVTFSLQQEEEARGEERKIFQALRSEVQGRLSSLASDMQDADDIQDRISHMCNGISSQLDRHESNWSRRRESMPSASKIRRQSWWEVGRSGQPEVRWDMASRVKVGTPVPMTTESTVMRC